MNQQSENNCQQVEKKCNTQVFLLIRIYPKENQKADAGAVQKTCDQMTCGQHAVQVHLGQQDGSAAVRNQADQRREEHAGDRTRRNNRGQAVLTEKKKGKIQKNRDRKDK